MRNAMPRFVYWMLGILALAALFFLLGEPEKDTSPTARNRTGGGYSVLVELLRKRQYVVDQSMGIDSRWGKEDLIFWVRQGADGEPTEKDLGKFKTALVNGAQIWQVSASPELPSSSDMTSVEAELLSSEKLYTLLVSTLPPAVGPVRLVEGDDYEGYASIQVLKKSTVVTWALGDHLRNDFIRSGDHALLMLDTLQAVAPGVKRIIFYEADAPGAPAANYWGQLAPWGPSFYWQFILVAVVGVYALGRRLGPPETEALHVTGGRKFVDAFAVLIQRSRSNRIALTVLESVFEKRLRRAMGIPAHAPISELHSRLTQEQLAGLRRLSAGTSGETIPDVDAFLRAKAALDLVEEIESSARSRR
jgi:hypothetical protein